MNSVKKIIFFVVVLAVIVGAGFFLWNMYNGDADLGIVFLEDFEITESDQNKIISHKNSGFSMTIPADWEVEGGATGIYMVSGDFQRNTVTGPYGKPAPDNGCIIELDIRENINSEEDAGYRYIKNTINACREIGSEFCDNDFVVTVSGKESLKHIASSNNDKINGDYIKIDIPYNNLYTIGTYFSGDDRDRCEEEFDKILKNVKIK